MAAETMLQTHQEDQYDSKVGRPETPPKLLYLWMACNYKLECRSDSGFRREEDKEGLIDGRSARGASFLRLGLDASPKEVCHLIDVSQ